MRQQHAEELSGGRTEAGSAPKEGRVPAVLQAVRILRCLTEADRPLNVSSVARTTGISASTCFNILRTLAGEDLLSFDPENKTYEMGFGVLEFSAPVLTRDRVALIRPMLARIALEHHVALTLWQVTANERLVLIDSVRGNAAVQVDIRLGARLPLLAGAIGRCVAAAMRLPEEALHQRFATVRWQDRPSFEVFLADVRQAQKDGYALDLGHWHRGVHVAGTAVLNPEGQPVLCIGGLALAGQRSEEQLHALGKTLRDAARLIGLAQHRAVPLPHSP